MKHRISIATLFATLALGLAAPASASPATIAMTRNLAEPATTTTSQVQPVQHRWRGHDQRRWHRGEHWHHRQHRRYYRPDSGFYFQFGGPPVYRRHAAPRRAYRYRLPPAHYDWCQARYRSYRASDNSFQPYNGPRRQCRSPYL